MSGVVFHGIFCNPLAEPYLLGSIAGASVGAAIALLSPLLAAWPLSLPLLAFDGIWGVAWLMVLARLTGVRSGTSLILAGVAKAGLLSARPGSLVLFSALGGGALLMLFDGLSRSMLPPQTFRWAC